MNKKSQNKNQPDKVIDAVKTLSKEQLEHLAKEYKREQDLKRNLQRLKLIMARTYISKLIH